MILPIIRSVCCHTTLWKLEVWVLAYLKENAYESVTYTDFWTENFNPLNLLVSIFVNSRRFYLNKCCELKQHFLHVCCGIDQTIVDNAIDEWRGRLCTCVWAKGGHFEQLLWQYSATRQETFQFLSNVTRFLDCFFGNYHKFKLLIFTR